ncbi:hypothetical protein [Mycobacteroides abscessus]|uniref:hypothetical protein n=1 Tax=Mycobacteroides abscessus TaxID=36809 RepID=UPI0009A887CC|nr:hypothetical protein [Mycobacteroides abscessus]SLH38191.1 Uncharacterised protein [Mycobacteroides abscessus subsp. massiliense]
MATTYRSALEKIGVSIPAHLEADAEVPVLDEPQAQGDLTLVPLRLDPVPGPDERAWQTVPDEGIAVVHGEGTGNTHWLHRGFDSPGVSYVANTTTDHATSDAALVIGFVRVPEGQCAELIHTDDHGCNAMAPGDWTIRRKREQAYTVKIVAD